MVPLILHSHYSLMWGVNSAKQICRRARLLGYRSLALTDTDSLAALWPFLKACRSEGIVPIIGAEVTDPNLNQRVVCLVENISGYHNLCRLLTRRHLDKKFNLKKDMVAYGKGLVVLTESIDLLKFYHKSELFVAAAMLYMPIFARHPLIQSAKSLNLPVIAAPGSFFLHPEDFKIHRMLRAIFRNVSLSNVAREDMVSKNAWLAGPAEYDRRFEIYPESIYATEKVAERLSFRGPDFGLVLPVWEKKKGRGGQQHLRTLAYKGAYERYGNNPSKTVTERLEHELSCIGKMGFSDYFLIVRDIVKFSPRTCGRGSGAASLVAYCLGITNVCPIQHNLYFERFLNPGRKDPPDIDVDFAWDERDDVLDEVFKKYLGHAAMVSSHVLFQPRMAIREVAKVYGLTDGEIGRVSKKLPWFWRVEKSDLKLMEILKQRSEFKLHGFSDPWPEILYFAQCIVGNPRYFSVHPGGIVITPNPIEEYVPIQRASKNVPIMQWEKDSCEDAGLVKIDLLGNRSLGVIRDALSSIKENGIQFNESDWCPEEDFITQETVAQGNTMGCFYIESPAMRLLQKKARVGDFEHLVIHSSIIRPAANDFIQEYIRRLHGGKWEPIHPLLTDVLNETFGIMVYQEDVSRVAVALSGLSHVEADGLRKVLSKKDREFELKDFSKRFLNGAKSKGLSKKQIDAVWDMMMSFNGYSFCKPHSASYARVSYQSAYLKIHYPAEFMAAVISNQGGFYSTFAYVSEARRMGLTILPPDINQSRIEWSGQGKKIRVGFLSIKDLSDTTLKKIVSRRQEKPFGSIQDFLERIKPTEKEAYALILCGAMDGLHHKKNRTLLLWEMANWKKTRRHKRKNPGLFDVVPDDNLPHLPAENRHESLRREFSILGFLCDVHPIKLYEDRLLNIETIKVIDLPRFPGKRVQVSGWLITGKIVRTKKGENMEFMTFEDETGMMEATFFPSIYQKYCHMMDRNRPYILTGKVEQDWGVTTLTVEKATPIHL